jgi:hypothetical protein
MIQWTAKLKKQLGNQKPAYILVTDLHLHHLPGWRLQWCDDFASALMDFMNSFREPLPTLVLAGDVTEIKDKLDARVMNILLEIIFGWPGDVIWISGQHDSYEPYKATLWAVGNAPGHITVVDDAPHQDGDGTWFVPYARHAERYLEWLGEIPDGDNVITHLPIAEILDQFPNGAPDGWPCAADFHRFGWVYSGDIHNRCKHGKVEYVGATSQRDWRDEGVEGCIGVLGNKGKLIRVPVEHPVHQRITSEKDLEKLDITRPTILRFQGFDMTDDDLQSWRDDENVIGLDWEPAPIEQAIEEGDGDNLAQLSPVEVLQEYMETVTLPEDGLDPEFLLEVGKELCDAAL